jgi:hypothetical protein
MMKPVLSAFLLLSALACGGPQPQVEPPESQAQVLSFTRLVDGVASLAQCEAATVGSGFNCTQLLTLCPNGGYSLMVTDIMNEGTFTRTGNSVDATQQGSGDGPAHFSAVLETQETVLSSAELAGEHPWERQALTGTDAQQAADGCAAMEGRTWWR